MTIKDLIKDNVVTFSYLRKGVAYYNVSFENITYVFPVSLEDIGDATLLKEDKAIMFMRYMRKALDNNELVKV